MGNWNITIRGVGCHHNPDLPTDANRMAAGFVAALKRAGHAIQAATFTHGGEENLETPFMAPTDMVIREPEPPQPPDA